MIEHARHAINLPLSASDRKRLYLIRLVQSPHWNEHEHAHRVADGLAVLRRLHQHWRRRKVKPEPKLLTLRSERDERQILSKA